MPATQSLPSFHQWLLGSSGDRSAACAIVLHRDTEETSLSLAEKVACYLNEYDGDGDGRWLAVSSDLITTISQDANQRALLGINDGCENGEPTNDCGLKKTIAALADRGHVVIDAPLAAAATRGFTNTFQAGIGLPPNGLGDCHLIVNPQLFPVRCIAQVVADVFLEWLACEDRCSARFSRL